MAGTGYSTGHAGFGGQLGQYHRELNNEILPALIDEYALDTEKLAYGGYSLGGLAATMSLWETDAFAAVFSLCGSFWYPGVADFIEEHVPKTTPHKFICKWYPGGQRPQQPPV